MCGLVGMVGNVIEQDKIALRWLLHFDAIRGMDSTGLAVVTRKDNTINVMKKVGLPDVLMSEPAFDGRGVYKDEPSKVFIGHNRAATRGSVTDENAHPFHHGDVVGAHNGTLVSTYGLEDAHKFDVDSEAIFYNLNKYDVKSVINDVDGAYALTWFDRNDNTMNILRNGERPLYWCRRIDNDVIYWASESWMLETVLSKLKIKHTVPVSFEIDKLYRLDVSDVSPSVFRNKDWDKSQTIKGYEAPKVVYKNKHSHVFTGQGGGTSNVTPFVGSPNKSSNYSARSLAEIMMMKAMVGDTIEFRIDRLKKGISKSDYLSAFPENPMADWDIRIYGHNHTSWNDWKKAGANDKFKGKIKKVVEQRISGKQEVYFLIDLRTIEEVVDKTNSGDNTDILIEGYNGRFLSKDEWDQCTKNGCQNCAGSASLFDQDLVFINHDEFICGDCIDQFPQHNPQSNNYKH